MKASKVLKKYAAGKRNFQRLNLRGQSFKGKDLSGANFSEADIRSTNFTNTNLIGANFTGAKCGLQRRWATLLTTLSWLLASISGFFSIFIGNLSLKIFDSNSQKNQIAALVGLLVLAIFLILAIRQGIRAAIVVVGAGLVGVAGLVVVVAAGLVAGVGEAAEGAVVAVGATVGVVAVVVGVGAAAAAVGATVGGVIAAAAVLGVAAGVIGGAATAATAGGVAAAGAAAVGTAIAAAGVYIGWRAMKGDVRDAWLRSFAIAIAATGGTSFCGADLTDANFAGAKLKSTDFRKATLTRVRWYGARMLDRVRSGDTYLKNISLRQLLITGNGQDQNFDRQDLRGVNLQGANLTNASFIDTDLSQANLQEATLFEAKLVQTNLDKANLSNANLTGAYIEDWGITRNTIFEGVKGDYVYQQLPTKYNRDTNQMPPSGQGNFGENELYIFITSVLDTLDLYHRQNINAGLAITVLKGLTEDYPVQFELAGIEKRGDSQYVMKLKVFGQASHFQLQQEYYARYEQTLPVYDPKMLMPDSENIVAEIIKTVKENPGTHIENLYNQGIFITGGKVNMSGDRNIEINQGNYNESIKGDYIQGNKTDHSRNQNISGGTINASGAGAFSLADISGTVANTISQLPSSSHPEEPGIKDLLIQIQEAINDPQLSQEDKMQTLEQLEVLAEAGQNPQDETMQKKAKKAVSFLKAIAEGVEPATKLAQACVKVLPKILAFFA